MTKSLPLQGKVIVVTGGSTSIGRVISEEIATLGGKVVINDIESPVQNVNGIGISVKSTVQGIKSLGLEAVESNDSIMTWEGSGKVVQCALDNYGRLDGVVTTGGGKKNKPIFDMLLSDWTDTINSNLKSTFNIIRQIAPIFRKQRGGRIVTLTADAALHGFQSESNYSAAKSGVIGFTKVLAKDLGKYGVTSNSIVPFPETEETDLNTIHRRLEILGLDVPIGESSLDSRAVCPFISYLLSDYSAPVNGQVFAVYGGTIALCSFPRRIRTIYKENPPGTWELSELDQLVPRKLLQRNLNYKKTREKRLQGKVAVVTGSGRGIGRAVAKQLAFEGASIVVNDIGANLDGSGTDLSPAQQVVEEINELGGRAVTSYNSVTDTVDVGKLIEKAINTFDGLDIVVTVAGILRDRMIFNMSEEEWDQVMDVHLNGTYNVVRAASPIFKKQGSGRIITFSSVSGLYGYAGQSNYGAAKEAIAGFTRSISEDMRVYGVTANIISPGAQTRMIESIPDSTKDMRKGSFGLPPGWLPRNKPEDVAPMIAWLSSDEASDVTGQIFHCVGNSVSLMNTPKSTRVINKDGRWSVEEISGIFEETLGMDLINPAPPND